MTAGRAAAAVAIVTLSGCTGQTWLYRHPRGWDEIVSSCPRGLAAEACQKLPVVQMTKDPSAREAWQYEARVKVVAPVPGMLVAAPIYGRVPIDLIIVGPREECERVRQLDAATGLPTEPCEGPLYFKIAD